MSDKIKNIVIIGDGIAAWCLSFYLKTHNVKIISGNDHFTPCSFKTTSINCIRGTKKGISPLGDLIYDSMEEFVKFFQSFDPQGICEGIEYQCWKNEDISKWERRYPDANKTDNDEFLKDNLRNHENYFPNTAYFIDPVKLRQWFIEHSQVELVNDFIRQINDNEVIGLNDSYKADIIILCSGHNTILLDTKVNSDFTYYLEHCKPVVGDYLELSDASKYFSFDKSFNIAAGKYHFIHRQEENIIHIGSTSVNNESRELPDLKKLKEIYDFMNQSLSFDLPDFDLFTPHCGIRHKGHKRLPYWGEFAPNKFAICGLYKNAFTFAFLAAKEIAASLK